MRIGLVEDDPVQSAVLGGWLETAGHCVLAYPSGEAFLVALRHESFDVVLLDWSLPGIRGIELLAAATERLERGGAGFLFVTAQSDLERMVAALEAGADDYLVKPVRRQELLARIGAVARRLGLAQGGLDPEATAPYRIDVTTRRFSLGDIPVRLTTREFELALFLFRHAGQVVSKEQCLRSVWRMSGRALVTRTLDTHVSRLRSKLALAAHGWALTTLYQRGYRLHRTGAAQAD